jgi:hypothetical protein
MIGLLKNLQKVRLENAGRPIQSKGRQTASGTCPRALWPPSMYILDHIVVRFADILQLLKTFPIAYRRSKCLLEENAANGLNIKRQRKRVECFGRGTFLLRSD